MGNKREGGVKNLKKWVTSFMDGPKKKINICKVLRNIFVNIIFTARPISLLINKLIYLSIVFKANCSHFVFREGRSFKVILMDDPLFISGILCPGLYTHTLSTPSPMVAISFQFGNGNRQATTVHSGLISCDNLFSRSFI